MAPSETPSPPRNRLRERLARSSHIFLLGLIVACGVEVLVDWNATFFEIGVLRDRVRERGVSYVSMLSKSASVALRMESRAGLTRLTDGLFDDADVVFVRFTNVAGDIRFERLDPDYGKRFESERGSAFEPYYAKLLARDMNGVLHDPEGQQERMNASHYRDIAQRYSDLMTSLTSAVSTPTPPKPHSALVLYQQALRTAEHTRDDAVTWAFGVVEDEGGQTPVGAVLVAFDMQRTNAAIRGKYLKGVGMVVFFVGLILVQNVSGRRDKLRLLDLELRHRAAKTAVRETLPAPVATPEMRAAGALEQSATQVDGMLVDLVPDGTGLWLLLLDPDGEGVDAAAVALHVRAAFRARRASGVAADLEAELRHLGSSAMEMPLTRPLGVILIHAAPSGRVEALVGPVGGLRHLSGGKASALLQEPGPAEVAGVVGPLSRHRAQLAPGDALLALCGGLSDGDPAVDLDSVAAFALRSSRPVVELIPDAATWARGNTAGREERDLALAGLQRV